MDEVTICYGMTETSPVSTQTRADDALERRVSTVGRVHPHVEMKIVDPDTGRVVAARRAGRAVHPRLLRDARLLERARADGRGDRRRAAGCTPATSRRWTTTATCNIVGRIKDMVIRGGENVYPREIEEFLYTHPDVADVQVIGVPDERYGEELCAWSSCARAPSSTRTRCASSAAGGSRTTRCRATCMFVDEFPMTVTGKVQKFKMRERRDRAARAWRCGGGEERRAVKKGRY